MRDSYAPRSSHASSLWACTTSSQRAGGMPLMWASHVAADLSSEFSFQERLMDNRFRETQPGPLAQGSHVSIGNVAGNSIYTQNMLSQHGIDLPPALLSTHMRMRISSKPMKLQPFETKAHAAAVARSMIKVASAPIFPPSPPPIISHASLLSAEEVAALRRKVVRDRRALAEMPKCHEDEIICMKKRTELNSSRTLENGTNTYPLHRSMRLCDCLWDLRRCVAAPGNSGDSFETAPSSSPVDPTAATLGADAGASPRVSEEEGDSILNSTLNNTHDTCEELRKFEHMLECGLKDVAHAGGIRHATAVISSRALLVISRKLSLMDQVVARLQGLASVHQRRDDVLKDVVDDTRPPPPELGGLPKFIDSFTHRPGNPADADKSNFLSFASSFKLPAKHQYLVKLRESAFEVGEWWADACLQQAEKGQGHAVLLRLFEIATGTGVSREHVKLIRAWNMVCDRLATRALKDAKDLWAADERMVARSPECPRVGPATEKALQIEKLVLQAVKDGVPERDWRLVEAMGIMKRLLEEDGTRKRLEARKKRMEGNA